MSWIKKFWIVFLSFLPFGAGAVAPLVVGLLAGGVGLAGFSVYRSMSPVNMSDAMNFFSTCWTCQLFSDIMQAMSALLPGVYKSVGQMIIPVAIMLTAIWFAFQLTTNLINQKLPNPWDITSNFSTHLIKLALVCGLLAVPLPRLITDIAIEPIFNVGLALNRTVAGQEDFDKCLIATAIADAPSDTASVSHGAFSPHLRYNLACQLSSVHQITGLGMTVGWTIMNMAFNYEYMHKIMWSIPVFPNVPMLVMGAVVLVLYFFVLLPIPFYFLEIFITLSMDLIMLPLTLLSWLFSGWKILPSANIKKIFDDVISGTLGLAITGVFLTFSIMFMNAAIGKWNGVSALQAAIESNNSKILMDSIRMNNDSLVTVILMGIFMAMFMTSIPALSKSLFSVTISTKFYDRAKQDLKIIASPFLNKIFPKLFNKDGAAAGGGGGGGVSGAAGNPAPTSQYDHLNWLQSQGGAYIRTNFIPTDDSGAHINVILEGSGDRALLGTKTTMNPGSLWWGIGVDAGGVYYCWNTKEYGPSPHTGGGTCDINFNFKNNRQCNVNKGADYSIPSALITGTIGWAANIFGYNSSGVNSVDIGDDKIRLVEFSKGSNVVHSFEPVRRKSDGALGMYDRIDGRFYGNFGPGNFVGG